MQQKANRHKSGKVSSDFSKRNENRGRSGLIENLKSFYFREYKKLMIIPVALFIFSALVLFINYQRTGEVFLKDVSLKGGITLTVNTDSGVDLRAIERSISDAYPEASVNIREAQSYGRQTGIIIEASDVTEDQLVEVLAPQIGGLSKEQYSVETMGSSLGSSFFREMFITLLLAFIAMGLVFMFYFRSMTATLAALISAFFNIFITLGIITLLDVRLTTGGIASFLMLIGYSIDTSILLSTKLLKKSGGNIRDSLFGAMKTGLTMSAAGIAATFISFLLTNNETLRQIMLILVIGLIIDVITTWIENAGLLRMVLESRERKNVKAH